MKVAVRVLTFVAVIMTTVVGTAQERQMGGIGITVFVDRNFRGRSATFRDDVPDLRPLRFNDNISSLRVGPGELWEVCEHSNYQGRCVVVSREEPDLRRNNWNDIISSLRRVRGGGGGGGFPRPPVQPPVQAGSIVLFDQTNFRGRARNFDGPWPSTGGTAQSLRIGGGVWQLCEGQNWSGR